MTVIDVLLLGIFVVVEILFLQFFMKFSADIHRRAQEILYAQDHGLQIDRKSGFFEMLALRQVTNNIRERERDLPRVGDLIALKQMYSHMFNVKDNPTYLVLGYSSNPQTVSNCIHTVELQRVDGQGSPERVSLKIADWDRGRYDIFHSSGGRN